MMIHHRLLACAKLIRGNFLCDVGTDHGLLPIYAVRNQLVSHAIACDIREQPLESARANVAKYQLSDHIQLILSDGLQEVPEKITEQLTDIVIAGMGGETIIHILGNFMRRSENKKILNFKNFILQPMTKAELLREWLYQNGYEIREEICIPDGKFLYAVLSVQYSGIPIDPDPAKIYFGRMNLHSQNGFAYAQRQYRRLCEIRDSRQSAEQDITALNQVVRELEECLSCKS
ncbi:MAG: class I SAM-dependent methyltransferase [Oscillospiraceae bacterium]|nr:class I SAM-dependent methyltransferase [Oscillospiraceae bacterium]